MLVESQTLISLCKLPMRKLAFGHRLKKEVFITDFLY